MLAFLKTIFGGRTAAPRGNVGLAIPRTVYTPQPRSTSHRSSKTPAQRPAQKPAPAPEPVPPAPAPVPESDSATGSDIDISLQSVLAGLPADLKDRVRDLDIRGATMTISLERILAQLPSGAVTISFGSLRHAAPQLFSAGADCDSRDVALPINEIVAKVNPAMICRPQDQPVQRFDDSTVQPQKAVESDASIPAGADSQTVQRASSLSVPSVAAPGATTESSPPAPSSLDNFPAQPASPTTSRRRAPKRGQKAAQTRIAAPQPAKPQEPVPDRAATAEKSTREEIPDLFFDARKAEHPNSENADDALASSQAVPVTECKEAGGASVPTSLQASPVPASQPAQPTVDQGVMRIPLKELTGLWPENVRSEVAHWNLDQLMVALPAERINAALKQGKVIFPWESLRSWILPPPPSANSLQDKALLELPLPVIMPLFLAARKQSSKPVAKPQPQIADDIPDPFADFLPSAGTAPQHNGSPNIRVAPTANSARAAIETKKNTGSAAAPAVEKSSKTDLVARQKASAPKPAPVTQKVEVEAVQAETPVEQSKSPTPAEVLAVAVKLEGVAGALVALPDGFKVASKLPPGLDGDALAAFLPHIFSKVNQSTRELRMGDLNTLNFTVDNVPWKIFRVNQIFFAALGHAGKPMPTDQLAALAHKLTFKN